MRRHGLEANGRTKYAPRGGLRREQLLPLVERGATLQEIADDLGRSTSTVRHWLAKHGLSTTRARRHSERARAAFEAGLTRFTSECHRHGPTEFLVFRNGRYRCARCNSEAVARRRRKVKATLVREAGGRCAICGYDRHPVGLQFHHLDPSSKTFGLSCRGTTHALAKSRAEAQKCILLCATCHAEVEAGVTPIPVELLEEAAPR